MLQALVAASLYHRWMAVNRATTKRYIGNLKRLGSKVPLNAPPGDERAMRCATHIDPLSTCAPWAPSQRLHVLCALHSLTNVEFKERWA